MLFWPWVSLTKYTTRLFLLSFSSLHFFSNKLYCFNVIFAWTVGLLRRSTNYWWFSPSLFTIPYNYLIIYSDFVWVLFGLTACGSLLSFIFHFIYCVLPLADVTKWGLVRLIVSSNSFVSMIYLVDENYFVISDCHWTGVSQ